MYWLLACAAPAVDSSAPEDSASEPPADDTAPDTTVDDTAPDTTVDDTAPDTTVDDTAPIDTAGGGWRSALYPVDWTPAFTTGDGHFLHDFSYAGYHAGEVGLPTLSGPSFDVTDYGADPSGTVDSGPAIQAAIDASAASALPAVVDLPAGTYRVDGTLRVEGPSIVLRGAGSASTFLYFTDPTNLDYAAHLTFSGTLTEGTDHLLSVDGVAREAVVVVADPAGIAVGDEVSVGWTITEEFVAEHGMTDTWVTFDGQWKAFFRRTVTAVDTTSGAISLDVPLRYPAKLRDGASLRVVDGYLTEVGLEGMSLSNAADWDVAWATTQVHLVLFDGVKDAWIRDIASWESPWPTDGRGAHLVSSGIEVLDSRRVTIADTTLAEAAHRGDGGNGYLFEISRSNEVLTVDAAGRAGRHNFIQNWDFGTSGCVWLRTTSEDGRSLLNSSDRFGYRSYSEFHHSLALANLIDQSVATDGWQGVNRQAESSGAGQSATQNVWWNTSGGGYLRSLQYGDGYVVGTTAMDVHVDPDEWDWANAGEGTAPEDWTEGLDEGDSLVPASLYEDQLARRIAR